MWLSHPEFPEVICDAWTSPAVLSNVVAKFVDKAKVWNKEVSRNLCHRKKRIVARLKGVQTELSTNPSSFLVDLDRTLKAEFMEISKLEEEF